jgi:hypothetical protein
MSAAEYGRLMPFQRGFSAQSFSRAAICCSRVLMVYSSRVCLGFEAIRTDCFQSDDGGNYSFFFAEQQQSYIRHKTLFFD